MSIQSSTREEVSKIFYLMLVLFGVVGFKMNFCGAIIIQIQKIWLLWVSKYFIIDFKFLDDDIDFPLYWFFVLKKTSLLG